MNNIKKIGIIALLLAFASPVFAYQRTITDPATNSSLSSAVIRAAFQTLEDEVTSLFTFTSEYATTTAATSTIPWFQMGLFASSTSNLASFNAVTSTTTSATTTNLATTWLCLDSCKNAWPTSSMTFAWPWAKWSSGEQATSTILAFQGGFFSNASSTVNNTLLVAGSSTLQNFSGQNATTTNYNVTQPVLSFGSSGGVYVSSTTQRTMPFASSTLDANGFSLNMGNATTTLAFGANREGIKLVGIGCQASTTNGVAGGFLGKLGTLPSTFSETLFCDTNYREYNLSTNVQIPGHIPLFLFISKASTTPQTGWVTLIYQKVSIGAN